MEDMYDENNVDNSTLQKLMNTMGSLFKTNNGKNGDLRGGTASSQKNISNNTGFQAAPVQENAIQNGVMEGSKSDLISGLNEAMMLGGAYGTVSNYIDSDNRYNNTIQRMDEAIKGMQMATSDVSGAFSQERANIMSDLSEASMDSSADILAQNRANFENIENTVTDFNTGSLQNIKEKLLTDVDNRLQTTFKRQREKTQELLERNQESAMNAVNRLQTNISDLQFEKKEVEKARDNALRNAVTEVAALASKKIDPTGITGDVIRSTKFRNRYT
tara:strand:- start:3823 stop:4644 length:822 start_codon:yes stop_codon:yes gene_type:complete